GPRARRTALWQLGIAATSQRTVSGEQLALQLPLPRAPRLRALPEWDALVADYATTGASIGRHPLELLRGQLDARGALPTAKLANVPHGREVAVGGLVIARQRPQTAGGVVFLLLEDEGGTLNAIVPAKLYEEERLIVRTEPLLLVSGRLERHAAGGGAINLLARSLERIAPQLGESAPVGRLRQEREAAGGAKAGEADATADDLKASVPPVQHFAQGRRR
ncbi:MAG: OB-fold nucleic acid binding domain-containing protein, partial [Solirubrobacteraceae bacterium]